MRVSSAARSSYDFPSHKQEKATQKEKEKAFVAIPRSNKKEKLKVITDQLQVNGSWLHNY